jgi:PAS domain S-box-containing protein
LPSLPPLSDRVTALPASTRYLIAVSAAVVATLARLALDSAWDARLPYITFFPAVMLSGWLGGWGPGLTTTLLSAVAASYFWVPTLGSLRMADAAEWLGLGVFIFVGLVMSALNEAWRRGSVSLSKSEQMMSRLAAIVEGSDDAIVSKDLEGTVQSWNRGAERIFGYTAEEMQGRSIRTIIPEDRWSEEDEVLRKIRLGESVDHFETVRRRKDGTEVHVSLTISPIHAPSGIIVGASKIARDISERKLVEAELTRLLLREQQARAEMDRASKLKDEFLAILSHELRTPLNAVLGYTQLLLSGVVPPKEIPQAVQAIQRNAQVQIRLVESLLDMSRVLAGKLELKLEDVSLSSVIEAAVDAVRPDAVKKNVELEVNGLSNPVAVFGDAARLQQVFWNLLTNAVKFTPPRGRVTVSVTIVGTDALIQISDTGRGISPDFLPYIFDRFEQAKREDARELLGLGIGLSLVRELVHAHGGAVTADSEGDGRGAVFSVTLPLAQASGKLPDVSRTSEADGLPASV